MMTTARMLRSICLGLLTPGLTHAFAQANWPEIPLPEHARSYHIGQQMDLDGLPMRLTGFATRSTPRQTGDWFVRTLGQPLMDDQRDGQRILGRAQGEHYLTIRLEPTPDGGTRGLVAVTHLRAALSGKARSQGERARWRRLLPAGTEIASLLNTQDGGWLSTHLIATNRHGEALNAQRLTAALQEQGYALERRFDAATDTKAHAFGSETGAITVLMRGPGKEATAVISRNALGLTSIVLVTSVAVETTP